MGSRWRMVLVVLTALTVPLALPAGKVPGRTSKQAKIIAYIFPRDRALQANEITVENLTRINYAFANIHNGQIVTGTPSDEANFATLVSLKQKNPSLEVLVSVGGWLWSGDFSDMALTPASRSSFIESVVSFVTRYKLDGLDIDWEYPGQIGAGNRFRPEDKLNYTVLIKELRLRFDREQSRLGRRLLLSVAAGASDEFIAHTDLARVARDVDSVNLMAYDYYEPASDKIAANHAPLYTDPSDPKQISADRSVRAFERAGVPSKKIVLGVPFYGHVWGDVAPAEHGLFQPGSPVPNAFASYKNIVSSMLGQGYTRYWDAHASVPYLYNEQNRQFVSYEDAESLTLKCAYVRRKRLGGVMFWDYTSDSSGALLNAIHDACDTAGRPSGGER